MVAWRFEVHNIERHSSFFKIALRRDSHKCDMHRDAGWSDPSAVALPFTSSAEVGRESRYRSAASNMSSAPHALSLGIQLEAFTGPD